VTQLGDGSKPTFSYFGYDGTSFPNQIVQKYTADGRIRLITLGAWVGGWSDTVHARLAVYAADGSLLGYSDEFIVADNGPADGDVDLYEADLQTPVVIEDGDDFYVGITKDRDDAAQWATGSNAVSHYEARGSYPDADLGAVSGIATVSRRVGAYVVDYQPVGVIYGRRSGAWDQAEGVFEYHSGAWVQVDAVQGLRSGVWTDAE
jgi:hypothetical protein